MAKILPEAAYRFHEEYIDPVLESVIPGYKPRTTSYKVGPYASGYVSPEDLQPLPEPEPERPQEWSALPPLSAQDKTRDFVRNLIMKAGSDYDTAGTISRYIVGDINAPLTQGGIGALDFTPAGLLFAGQQAYRDLKEIDPKVDPIYSPILPAIDLGLSAVEASVLGKPMVNALKNPAVKEFAKSLSEKLRPTELRGSLSQLSQLNRLNIVPDGPKGALTNVPLIVPDPEGFYSVVQETIPLIKRGKGTGQEFVDEMRSQAVKQGYPVKSFNNEIKAMGLNLDSEFTKEEFAQHFSDKRFTVKVVENRDIHEIEEQNMLEFDHKGPGETNIMIGGDHAFTMVRDPDSSNPMQRKYYLKSLDGEQVEDFTASTLAEAGVQARMFLDREGYTIGAASTGLKWMDQHALSDIVEIEEEYMLRPQQNRREFLITSPEVGEFKKGHFNKPEDTVVASVMASDWHAPIKTEKGNLPPDAIVLYGDELQSDLAMANSRRQQRTKIIESGVFPLLDDIKYLAEEFEKLGIEGGYDQFSRAGRIIENVSNVKDILAEANPAAPYYTAVFAGDVKDAILTIIKSISKTDFSIDQLDEIKKNPRLKSILFGDSERIGITKNSLAGKLSSARERLAQIRGVDTDVPNPWQDTWHELALKKLMRTAVDEGYEYVMVPKSETLVTKWSQGPATKEAPEGAYRKMYQTVYDRKIGSVLQKYAKKYNSELTDGELGRADFGDEPGMDESNLPVTLIRITPEMKKAVKQGQPLFNIAVGTAAGALSTLDQEEPAQ